MNLLASYITPNPQDYENPELDYVTALSRDCKRNALHLIVLRYQTGSRRSILPSYPGQPVNNVNSNGDNPFHTAATLGEFFSVSQSLQEGLPNVPAYNIVM